MNQKMAYRNDPRFPGKLKTKEELDKALKYLEIHLRHGWSFQSFGKYIRGGSTALGYWLQQYPEIRSLNQKYKRKQVRTIYDE